MVGHSHWDQIDGGALRSWNSAHPTQGCAESQLLANVGTGRLYCFAAN
jgi:hypothetical protein